MYTEINNQLFSFEVILIDSKTSPVTEKSIFKSTIDSMGRFALQSFESNIEFKLNLEEQRINSSWVRLPFENSITKFSILKCKIIKNDKNQNVNVENKKNILLQSFDIVIFVGNGNGI